jgi:hypothetical protein
MWGTEKKYCFLGLCYDEHAHTNLISSVSTKGKKNMFLSDFLKEVIFYEAFSLELKLYFVIVLLVNVL